jgi:hypothetical protein
MHHDTITGTSPSHVISKAIIDIAYIEDLNVR